MFGGKDLADMFGKIQITGTMEIVTGTHIGGSSEFSAIGAVDAPVIRDAVSKLPMIPGSSLKGKMRTLLAKKYSNGGLPKTLEDDDPKIVELFGGSDPKKKTETDPEKKPEKSMKPAKLLFSDMILSNKEDLCKKGALGPTEIKSENTINRQTAVANPRQIERVIRGAKFPLDIIYEVTDEAKAADAMRLLAEGFRLLEYDYIGGHGSRGYGKVKFNNLRADAVIGEIDRAVIDACNQAFSDFARE